MQGLTIDDNRGAFQGRADPFVQFPVYGLPASPVELIVMCRHDHGQICDYYEAKQRMMSTTENIPGGWSRHDNKKSDSLVTLVEPAEADSPKLGAV
jgi:hypothetical protein